MSLPDVKKIKTILLPSGRDYLKCREGLSETYDIDMPVFPERQLSVKDQGRHFIKAKGKDIPYFISKGYADLGITSSDVFENIKSDFEDLRYQQLDTSICSFELLIPKLAKTSILQRLYDFSEKPVSVATSFPVLLTRCAANLNLKIAERLPSGSVEIMPTLGLAEIAADTVATGETARANSLERVKIGAVHPTVLWTDVVDNR